MLSSPGDRLASRLSAFGGTRRVGRFRSQKISLVTQTVKYRLQCRRSGFDPWVDPLEKGMAIYDGTLAWEISQTEKPGGLQSMGSRRVGYN